MSFITKQENSHYRARYRDPNGRARSKSFARREDARAFLKAIDGNISRGEWVDPAGARTTFAEWAGDWWETTVRLRPSTRRGYRGHLDRHVMPYFGAMKLASIDYMTVERFIADRLRAGLSPKMVRESVSVTSLVMRAAMKANARRDNPAADHHVPLPRRRLREGDVLDMAQVHKLVEHVRDPYKPAVWLLVFTGLRPAELCGLRVRDLDFGRHVVTVRSTLMPVHRFADPSAPAEEVPYALVEGPPKTAAGDRAIPIPPWLSEDLAAMLAARKERLGKDVDRDGYLFQTRYGNPLNQDHFREKVVRPALRAAGLPETLRTYDLRHSHASLLIDGGANLIAVAQRMGHSDPSVTLRVYGHLLAGAQAKLTEQLDALREATAGGTVEATVVPLDVTRIGRG